MQLWFYKAEYGDWWDKVISWWTWGTYSHVELVFRDGTCFGASSRDGGCRFKRIPLSHKWTVVDIGHDHKEEMVRMWCEARLGCGYDWIGAVGCGVRLPWLKSQGKWYCTEVVQHVLREFGVEIFVEFDRIAVPNEMARWLVRHLQQPAHVARSPFD